MKYFLSAGEASGDLHAGELMAAIAAIDPEARFAFLGGDNMSNAAGGQKPVIHYREMAYMGFSEVIRHLPEVGRNLKRAMKAIDDFAPDALILIDYPSFNLRLAAYARRRDIPVYYYISPKLWAWKSWRIKAIRRDVRRVFSILPFEEDWFDRRGYKVDYVGNPSVEEVERRIAAARELPNPSGDPRPVLALIPGSREGELRCNLPVMAEVARRHPEMRPVIAAAPALPRELYSRYGGDGIEIAEGSTLEVMKGARAALVTSGTATLECALCATPQVVLYRSSGSKVLYKLFRPLIRVPWVSLPNLIVGREVIPEMLMYRCEPSLVDEQLCAILADGPARQTQLDGYREMRHRLGTKAAASTAAALLVVDLLSLAGA